MKNYLSFAWIACLLALSLPATAGAPPASGDDYDRMDGTGASGKKVNVIEWEGNLEIHVYPAGSLVGLGLKLDKRNKDRPVMVIAYRFDSDPQKPLIRRAILGIDLAESFKAYRDPSSGGEYDKIVISNNGLAGDMIAYKLDAAPTQLYPDGHPALAQGPDGGKNGYQSGSAPAGAKSAPDDARAPASAQSAASSAASSNRPADPQVDDAGTIEPFFMHGGGSQNRR
jgi:hypothetical protein